MTKTERLIEMMITINAKRSFTARELAEEFSVSKRTILRDLQILEQIGFPLYAEVGAAGGYHVLKERILPPITFSENEAKAIFFACQSLQFYRDLPFSQERLSILKKFLNCLPPDIQHNITQIQKRIVFWTPDRYCDSPQLKALLDLVIQEQPVIISYSSQHQASTRTIIPLGLYANNGLWYCPAYCLKAKAIREFRVDRICTLEPADPGAAAGLPVLPALADYLAGIGRGSDYHLQIQLTPAGVKRCETEYLLAQGLQVSTSGDGLIELDISAATLDWVADYLLPLGRNATILEPAKLREIIQEKAAVLYQHHTCT